MREKCKFLSLLILSLCSCVFSQETFEICSEKISCKELNEKINNALNKRLSMLPKLDSGKKFSYDWEKVRYHYHSGYESLEEAHDFYWMNNSDSSENKNMDPVFNTCLLFMVNSDAPLKHLVKLRESLDLEKNIEMRQQIDILLSTSQHHFQMAEWYYNHLLSEE